MVKYLVVYLLVVNLITFFLYGIDKRRAVRKAWRIPESVLIGFAAIGGSVGAFLAMLLFRHKTQHKKFKHGIPLILLAQIAGAICILLLYE